MEILHDASVDHQVTFLTQEEVQPIGRSNISMDATPSCQALGADRCLATLEHRGITPMNYPARTAG